MVGPRADAGASPSRSCAACSAILTRACASCSPDWRRFCSAACQPEADTAAPQVRPVRTVTVVKRDVGETVSFTGRIQAENEARLAFRIPGRMIERPINVGDHVEPGQVVARLEPQDELNALRTAQAGVAAEQAALNAEPDFFYA